MQSREMRGGGEPEKDQAAAKAPAAGERDEDLASDRLVARFQAGDREAYADLYTRHLDHVFNYMRLVLGDPHEAEDATQQVFTNVLEALPRYERRQPFRAWLFTVARNHALSRLAQQNRLEPLEDEELNRRREEAVDDEQLLRTLGWITDVDLLTFMDRLSLPQRQVLVLRYMLDLPHKEIARVLGRSHGDVRILHHRSIQFLKDRLKSIGRIPSRGDRGGDRIPMKAGTPKATVLRSRRYSL